MHLRARPGLTWVVICSFDLEDLFIDLTAAFAMAATTNGNDSHDELVEVLIGANILPDLCGADLMDQDAKIHGTFLKCPIDCGTGRS